MTLQLGELVLVNLQPYRQTSLTQQPFSKLNKKFYGPYRILAIIGQVAYKVELPTEVQIHPVFHISQLKNIIKITCYTQLRYQIPLQQDNR